MEKLTKKRLKKLRARNVRSLHQRGLVSFARMADLMSDSTYREIGSSSINDPHAHVARVKRAMGIVPSLMDGMWASVGDTDASLYIGFQPGRSPTRIHPQLWIRRFVEVMPQLSEDTLEFIDAVMSEMYRVITALRDGMVRPLSFDELKDVNDSDSTGVEYYDLAAPLPLPGQTVH